MKKFMLKQTLVWFVILVGLILFTAGSFIIGQNKGTFLRPVSVYESDFKEATGLFPGSEVSIHGVRTGNVLKTDFLKDGRVRVAYSVRKKHGFVINGSTRSELKYQGVLGDRYISLSTEDFSLEPLPGGVLIPSLPSKGALGLFSKDEFQSAAVQAARATALFAQSLNDENTAENLNKMFSPENRRNLDDILKTAARILKKIDSGEGSLGALINNRSLYNRLMALLGGRKGAGYMEELSQKSGKKK